jgi:hypothetical protein
MGFEVKKKKAPTEAPAPKPEPRAKREERPRAPAPLDLIAQLCTRLEYPRGRTGAKCGVATQEMIDAVRAWVEKERKR